MKKILIVGDFSSLGTNLKKGLIKNGVEVVIVSDGDSWKNIVSQDRNDINIKSRNLSILGKRIRGSNRLTYLIEYFFKIRKKLKSNKFDVIYVMNQKFISNSILPSVCNTNYLSYNFLKNILKKNGKIYMLACGDDSYYLNSYNKYRYFPYLESEVKKSIYSLLNSKLEYDKLLLKIDGIIPSCWDYAEAYRLFYKNKDKIKKTIQFPIDLSDIEYKPNLIKDKIVIFHGLNREDFKGTKYIKQAMENIQRKYPDKVEIIIDGKMPLEDYKKVLEKANIVIDQTFGYSYGMNALISMAQGKLVFGGNESECSKELERNDIPVINILPEAKDIEEKLEYYVNNPQLIVEIGEKSRKFVEEFHECSVVAKKYIEIFEEKGDYL